MQGSEGQIVWRKVPNDANVAALVARMTLDERGQGTENKILVLPFEGDTK